MYAVIHRWPMWGSAVASVVTISYTESWAFPVSTYLHARSNITVAHPPEDTVEFGHKEET